MNRLVVSILILIAGCETDSEGLQIARWREKSDRLDSHCRFVHSMIQLDATNLKNPQYQVRAAADFMLAPQHSRGEIELCLGYPFPPHIESTYSQCAIEANYVCLAGIASTIEGRLSDVH